jgi:hypothetical protein
VLQVLHTPWGHKRQAGSNTEHTPNRRGVASRKTLSMCVNTSISGSAMAI